MASARNNRTQDRRTALREQQRRERAAADDVFKLLDAEEKAREATAEGVVKLVNAVGRDRASEVTGLEARDITAYVKLHEETNSEPTDGDSGAIADETDSEPTADQDSGASIGQDKAAVPAQAGQVPAAAG